MAEQQVTVSVDWLTQHMNDDDLVIIDGSWHLPQENRDPKAEYLDGHIPGAIFFDLNTHSHQNTDLPHMMPSADQFSREMGELGVSQVDTIVVYDTTGLFSAGRIWWMFRQFGAANTYVLDGGLPAWVAAEKHLESGDVYRPATKFNAAIADDLTIDLAAMRKAVTSDEGPLLLDARSAGRFYGRDPEPRPGARGGHMPGAVSLPFTSLLDSERKLLPPPALKELIDAAGFDPSKPTIATCGSGVTACVILLALARLGHTDITLYDASWSEWGDLADTPIETE